MNTDDQKLIAFFKGRKLPPKGYFQLSAWDATFDLKNTIELAIKGLKAGDGASRETLKRVRQRLEMTDKAE